MSLLIIKLFANIEKKNLSIGAYGLTLGIEITLNWFTSCPLMTLEVLSGKVAPRQSNDLWFWPGEMSAWQWWINTTDIIIQPHNGGTRCQRIIWHQRRSLLWMVYAFILCWPAFVGISLELFNHNNYDGWTPEFLIAIYGSVLAAVTTPIWAIITLVDVGIRLSDIDLLDKMITSS